MKKVYSEEELQELEKSMKEIGFAQADIEKAIEKAKENTDDIDKAKKEEDPNGGTNPGDGEGIEDVEKGKKVYEAEMSKAISDVNKAIADVNKAIATFQDLQGKLPGSTAPVTTNLGKSVEEDIDKSVECEEPAIDPVVDPIEKSFGKDDFMKSMADMFDERVSAIQDSVTKAISDISDKYESIEKSMEQFMDSPSATAKAITHNYSTLEKSAKTTEDGRKVVSLSNKKATLGEMEKALKSAKPEDKSIIMKAIPGYEISKSMDKDAFNIIKSLNNIEFEE